MVLDREKRIETVNELSHSKTSKNHEWFQGKSHVQKEVSHSRKPLDHVHESQNPFELTH